MSKATFLFAPCIKSSDEAKRENKLSNLVLSWQIFEGTQSQGSDENLLLVLLFNVKIKNK